MHLYNKCVIRKICAPNSHKYTYKFIKVKVIHLLNVIHL